MSTESMKSDRMPYTRNDLTEVNSKIKNQKAKTTKTLREKDAAFAKISQEEWVLLNAVGTAVKFSTDLAQRHLKYIEANKKYEADIFELTSIEATRDVINSHLTEDSSLSGDCCVLS